MPVSPSLHTRIAGLLLLFACGSTAPKSPQNHVESQGPEPGVFLTPPSHEYTDNPANQLYVSIWLDNKQPVLSLLCAGPCLPNKNKPYGADAQSYRSERLRAVGAGVWEATMRFESGIGDGKTGKDFTMRLELGASPRVEFDGARRDLERVSFQDAAYHMMSRPGQREAMLFSLAGDTDEFLIKTAQPADGKHFDDTFLYLAGGKTQTVHARNWRYRLEHEPDTQFQGVTSAVLHGEIALPGGDAAIDVDVLRDPESDVSFRLTRANQPAMRFWQSNDSNTHRFENCTGGACRVLLVGERSGASKCRDHGGRFVLRIEPDGGWTAYFADDTDQLFDALCMPTLTLTYVDDFKVTLKDASGATVDYTRKPESWEKP